MDEIEYRKMFEVEDTHWWFRGKRAVVGGLIARFAPADGRRRALDVGCGTGANLGLLAGYGDAFGIDLHPLALELSRRRCRSRGACPPPPGRGPPLRWVGEGGPTPDRGERRPAVRSGRGAGGARLAEVPD